LSPLLVLNKVITYEVFQALQDGEFGALRRYKYSLYTGSTID